MILIKTRIQARTIQIDVDEDLIGKDVEILIQEVRKEKEVKKKWRHRGAVDLKGKYDHVNIRDFAHE